MLDVDLPAFYVADVCHLQKLIHEGHSGSLLIQNENSSLFSNPFQAYKALLDRGATAASQGAESLLIVLQMQTPIIFLSCHFFKNPIP